MRAAILARVVRCVCFLVWHHNRRRCASFMETCVLAIMSLVICAACVLAAAERRRLPNAADDDNLRQGRVSYK